MTSLPARLGAAVLVFAGTLASVLAVVPTWTPAAKGAIAAVLALAAFATLSRWTRGTVDTVETPAPRSTTFDTEGGSLKVGKARATSDDLLKSRGTAVDMDHVVHEPGTRPSAPPGEDR